MRLLRTLLLLALLSPAARADFHRAEYQSLARGASHLPAPFQDYIIFPGSTSPDGRFAFIYPCREALPQSNADVSLVALHPFRRLLRLPNFPLYLAGGRPDSFEVFWAPDSSAAVSLLTQKWGPAAALVIPLVEGKPGKLTDLIPQITRQALPLFRQAQAEPYNSHRPFIFEGDPHLASQASGPSTRDAGWSINRQHQVIIDCSLNSCPNLANPHPWIATVKGLWDIAGRKFLSLVISPKP